MSMQATLVMHAIGAPLGFALISLLYFKKFPFTSPLNTALLFLGIIIGMDILVAAMLIEKSFAMFASPLGTWLPLALIFSVTYLTGAFCKPRSTINREEDQDPGDGREAGTACASLRRKIE